MVLRRHTLRAGEIIVKPRSLDGHQRCSKLALISSPSFAGTLWRPGFSSGIESHAFVRSAHCSFKPILCDQLIHNSDASSDVAASRDLAHIERLFRLHVCMGV